MGSKLKSYFPMIRTRAEVLEEIRETPKLKVVYEQWNENGRKQFLDFCSGARGVKILYDAFFKEILNPEAAPERVENLLSVILRKKVRLMKVLPTDNSRIADESSLLIMDILVELEDGSMANVEAQKVGYDFPGERSACYSADLLLRQYKRVRSEKKEDFRYSDVKQVYTIVFFEDSQGAFKEYPNTYIHRFKQRSDSGIEIELLQEFIFIPLDIFHALLHNNSITIDNIERAWLAFLIEDTPERIIQIIEAYPEFRAMYTDLYRMCRNMENLMGIFSEELRILDRNTVKFMIDRMQEELDEKDEIIARNRETIANDQEIIAQKDEEITRLLNLLEGKM